MIMEKSCTIQDVFERFYLSYEKRNSPPAHHRKTAYQSIHQPCNRCFSAPAVATEQDAFSVRNFQIDVAQPTMFLPRIGKRYIFKLNQPITPPRTHNSKIR